VTATPVGDGGTHAGSVGRPLPGVTVRIIDPDGNEVPTGKVGQITVHGERHKRSYFRDPEGSTQTWDEGWLLSGDLGFADLDGFLWVVGRQKELIIRGGHNIVPGEVETALFEYPDVVEAAVTGIPHPVLGEDVAAWLVMKTAQPPSVESVRAFLLERLADYKVPRRITFVDALPRNEAGKVVKARLMMDDEDRSNE
jgi:acyl-CoA synthetase (AMP-forming)/AMP-acid ligase II